MPADTSRAARDAEAVLDRLAGWVGGVYLRYPDAPDAAGLLAVASRGCRGTALAARRLARRLPTRTRPATAVGDWHDRQRPGVVARIRDYAGLCSLEAHRPGADRHTPAPIAPTADAAPAIAAWWATARDRPSTGTHRRAARRTRRRHRAEPADDHHSESTRSTPATTWAAGLTVAAGAGVATAHGLYQVAAAARVPAPIAWLYPLITDGLALVAYAATARLHDGGRRYAAGIVVLAAGLSGLAQAVYLAGGLDRTRGRAGRAAVRGRRLAGDRRRAHRAPAAPHQHADHAPTREPVRRRRPRTTRRPIRTGRTPVYNPAYNPPVQPRPSEARTTPPVQPGTEPPLYTRPATDDVEHHSNHAAESARDRARGPPPAAATTTRTAPCPPSPS